MLRLYNTAKNAYRRARGLPVPQLVLRGHTGAILSVAFLPDGEQVISGSHDGSVRAWRVLGNGDEGGTVTKEGGWVHAVATSSDGRWVAGGTRMTITIWNATTYEKVVELEGHTDTVTWLAFSPDSVRVASGSRDGTVVVWSATTGEQLVGPLGGHAGWVWCVAFSPDGNKIASSDWDVIQIWNSHSGELVLPGIHVNAVSVAWTPDGQRLIAGSWGGSIKFLDASTGSLLAESTGHTDIVRSIVVPLNGKFTASASWDSTVRLWDTTTCQQIGPALQHKALVESVAISPDGRHLVSGGGHDMKVRIWNLQDIIPPSLLENASTTSNNEVEVCPR
ncbi:WD40 repeat-like protein [Paxillus ammoniavirescens]|nr:WD40 repeat-like protein [Paxillus ammoniavirescens]